MTIAISSSHSNFNLYCFKLRVSVKCSEHYAAMRTDPYRVNTCPMSHHEISGHRIQQELFWFCLLWSSNFKLKEGGQGKEENMTIYSIPLCLVQKKKPRLLETDQSTSQSWTKRETAHVRITDRVMEAWYPSLRAFIPHPILCCSGRKILGILCAERSCKTCRKVDIRRKMIWGQDYHLFETICQKCLLFDSSVKNNWTVHRPLIFTMEKKHQ